MSNDFAQFQDAFFEEATEHLAIVEEGLLALEQHPEDLDLLNKIFRSAHSIKGTSGMFGFNAVAQFTHKMETLLDLLRNGQKVVTPQVADLLLKSTDCLKTLIDAAKSGLPVDDETVQRLTVELAAASAAGEGARVAGQGAKGEANAPTSSSPLTPHPSRLQQYTIAWMPPVWLFQRGLDPLQIFNELGSLGTLSEVIVDTSRLPDLATIDPEICYFSWTMKLETAENRSVVEAVFEFVREDSRLVVSENTVSGSESQVSSSIPKHETRNAQLEIADGEPQPLGEILVESGVVSRQTLDNALAQQCSASGGKDDNGCSGGD